MIAKLFELSSIGTNSEQFFRELEARLAGDARLLTYYARAGAEPNEAVLTAVIQTPQGLDALRTSVELSAGIPSLTPQIPSFHVFEREIYEQLGLKAHGHPWLKPLRFSGDQQGRTRDYPFYRIEGKEVHEVAVGPIHAGVIEPGHFRFMCLGETIHHLEIQLGFAHRGVEALLHAHPPWSLTPWVETIVGDTSVGHAWAYCAALESLAQIELPLAAQVSRGIALELERIAMHLASLSGLATDIGFLQGAATYARLRTTAINTTMLLCGSRFGRGWLRPAGSRVSMSQETIRSVRTNLSLIERDIAIINAHFMGARSVAHRLRGIGTLTESQATELGVVGVAARASGQALDQRACPAAEFPYGALRPKIVVETSGDCWARAVIRIREIDVALEWLYGALHVCETRSRPPSEPRALQPNALSVAVCEGWRGEVVHCLETNSEGALRHFRVQDPSLRNWIALALCVRDNEIYDFPICNKSFDLSYCGNDL
jgi:Ni,Fe-hydrogenase III large subunit